VPEAGVAERRAGARELRLPARPSELKRARDFASAAADDFGFDPRDRYQFTFAASEAVANAIEHGSPCADGKIGLRLVEDGETLTLSVCDCGTFRASVLELDELAERGRGLALIATLMDAVDLRPSGKGTLVRLSKRRG
jgi:serine/threonine-protein kinase RsbW